MTGIAPILTSVSEAAAAGSEVAQVIDAAANAVSFIPALAHDVIDGLIDLAGSFPLAKPIALVLKGIFDLYKVSSMHMYPLVCKPTFSHACANKISSASSVERKQLEPHSVNLLLLFPCGGGISLTARTRHRWADVASALCSHHTLDSYDVP